MRKKPFSIAAAVAFATLSFCGSAAEARRVAVFVQNKSGVADIDDVVADIRERVALAFADVDGFKVVATPSPTAVPGCSTNAVAATGYDFAAVATVLQADTDQSNGDGILNNEYSLRMAFRVTNASGELVGEIPSWSGKYQMIGAGLMPADCYRSIIDDWGADVSVLAVTKAGEWPVKATNAAKDR